MKRSGYMYVLCLVAIASCPAWADSEFSDAPSPYGVASHTNGTWQRLGDIWDTESGPNPNDSSDDGVTWSTDGGQTWGTDQTLTRGQEVTFSFDMRRAGFGRHTYDQLKAWVDWNGDKVFDDSANSNEVILYEKWWKGNTRMPDNEWEPADDVGKVLQKTFFATVTVPDATVLEDIWLRARVHCNHITFGNLTPYGRTNQGEVEDYELSVVPTPTAVLLGVIGLGFANSRLRRRRKA